MQIGTEPKSKDIVINKIGKIYEIQFEEGKAILWLDREEMIMLRSRIAEALKENIDIDKSFDMLREKQDYIDSINNSNRFNKDENNGEI